MTLKELLESLSAISDEDLENAADEELLKLCKSGGKSFRMSVPVNPRDTDMVFRELINRFQKQAQIIQRQAELIDELGKGANRR